MSDLLQCVDIGTETSNAGTHSGDLAWHNHTQYVVPAANRRRILDREHSRGYTPGPDGWLVSRRSIGSVFIADEAIDVVEVIRIRWEPHKAPDPDIQNLDDAGGEW